MAGLQRNWRWVVVMATAVTLFIADGGCLSTTGLYLSTWKEHFQCSMAEISVVPSLTVLSYHIGGLSGTVVNIVGFRIVVTFSGFMAAFAVFVSSFATSRIWLGFTFGFVAGFFSGSPYPGCTLAVASYISKNYTTIWGLTSIGSSLGAIVFPPLTQYLIDRYGWRGAMMISSGIIGHVIVSGMLLRPVLKSRRPLRRTLYEGLPELAEHSEAKISHFDSKEDCSIPMANARNAEEYSEFPANKGCNETKRSDNQTACGPLLQLKHENQDARTSEGDQAKQLVYEQGIPDKDDLISDYSDVVKVLNLKMESNSTCTRVLYTLGVPLMLHSFRVGLLVISQFSIGVCFNFILSHLHASLVYRELNSQTASWFISMIGIGSTVGRGVSGLLVDCGCVSAKNLYSICMAIFSLCVILYRVAMAYWIYALLSFGIGVSSGIFFSLEIVLSRVYVGKEHMGRAIAAMFLSHGTGGFVGPLIGGWAFDVTGSYDYPFYVFGGIVLASSFLFFVEPKLGDLEAKRAAKTLKHLKSI